ncbi:helix-turn-helix domain-containing protein [Priestia megaterium]
MVWWKNPKRSKFGRWLDKIGIQQKDFADKSKVSRATISKLCNDSYYSPGASVLKKVMKTIRTIDGSKRPDDFFDI